MEIWSEVAVSGVMAAFYTIILNKHTAKWLMKRQLVRAGEGEPSDKLVAQRVRLSRSACYSLCASVPLFSRLEYPVVVFVTAGIVAFVFPITWVIQKLIAELLEG